MTAKKLDFVFSVLYLACKIISGVHWHMLLHGEEKNKNTTHYQKCNHEAVKVFPLLKGSYYVLQHHTVLEFCLRPLHTDRQHYTSRQHILEAG